MKPVSPAERICLSDLARRVAEIASEPVQAERRRTWYALNRLDPTKPLVFCSPEGAWVELIPDRELVCEQPLLREWELSLRQAVYAWEHFDDDQVTDAVFHVPHVYSNSGWGLDAVEHARTTERGSYVWDAPVKELSDLDRLHAPEITIDWEASRVHLDLARELFGDILRVEQRTMFWWSLGIMMVWARLRGLEQIMLDMVLEPEWTHRACQFLADGRLAMLDQLESLGVLPRNDGNHYVGSGTFGFTDELPGSAFDGHVTTRDMWGFTEAQEITGVSPAMHWDFAMQYEVPIHERFGLTYYGCCEPLDRKFEYVKRLPNLRAVSISPWCDTRVAAEALADRYVYSWKPHPGDLAALSFDGDHVRQTVRKALDDARDCAVVMSLKDTHTCNHRPERFDEWTRIAQSECRRAADRG